MNESVEVNEVGNPPYPYGRPGFRTADLSEHHAHPLEMLEPANFAGSKAASGSKSKEVFVHDSSLRFESPADRPCSLQVRAVGLWNDDPVPAMSRFCEQTGDTFSAFG